MRLRSVRLVASTLLDLLEPVDCAGCGAGGSQICAACQGAMAVRPRRVQPDPCPPGFPATWAGPAYAGPARHALLAWKEHGRAAVRHALAPALEAAVLAAASDRSAPLLLVPVPTRKSSEAARGGDPLLDLARVVGRRLQRNGHEAFVCRALAHVREVRDQAGLTATERAANLRGAFGVRSWAAPVLRGGHVVVVDDIVTTGSTLTEAARALGVDGIEPTAACVAATSRTALPVDRTREED